MIGGSNFYPESRSFDLLGYACVDDDVYEEQSKHTWTVHINKETGRKDVRRSMKMSNGHSITIILAREILHLPRNPGRTCTEQADHINLNTLDCQRHNLRIASNSTQMANQSMKRTNKSGYAGVLYRPRFKKFTAQSKLGNKCYHLGSYDTAEEAARAVNQFYRLYHPEVKFPNPEIENFQEEVA